MNNLRKKASLFFYKNQNKGISNLMLYISIGNAMTWLASLSNSSFLYNLLCFDRASILNGQIWRLISYVFTYLLDTSGVGIFLGIFSLLCYYTIGRSLEQMWGTLRFNVYYFTGVLMTDVIGMLLGLSLSTAYVNMSLFLALATIMPDTQFRLYGIIPVKAKYLAWIDIVLTLWGVINTLWTVVSYGLPALYYLYAFYPLVALLNYILFFGKDISRLLPDFLRYRSSKTQRNFRTTQQTYQAKQAYERQHSQEVPSYRHKCTVCGRTDVTNPELEFRYCSKCVGFHCYCEDHINSHVHIQAD